MNGKNGFLLIELVGGLSLLLFLLFIIVHFTIQSKKIQQHCIKKMQAFSIARNCAERLYTALPYHDILAGSLKDLFSVRVMQVQKKHSLPGFVNSPDNTIFFYTICVEWKINHECISYILPVYSAEKLDN